MKGLWGTLQRMRWPEVLLSSSIGFGFGVWLTKRGVREDAAILLSLVAALAVLMLLTPKPKHPRPGNPEG